MISLWHIHKDPAAIATYDGKSMSKAESYLAPAALIAPGINLMLILLGYVIHRLFLAVNIQMGVIK